MLLSRSDYAFICTLVTLYDKDLPATVALFNVTVKIVKNLGMHSILTLLKNGRQIINQETVSIP